MLDRKFLGVDLKRLLCLVTVFGVSQFILLTFIAGLFYPGGYDYFGYYFSDLGAVVARNGEANRISSMIFSFTLMVTALSFIPFWIIIRSLFTGSGAERLLSNLGSVLGLFSSPFIIAIGLFPIDTNLETHFIVTLAFFGLFTVASLLYSVAILVNRGYPNVLGFIGLLLFGVSMFVYLNHLASYVAFLQNVLAYGYFLWILAPIKLLWENSPI